MKRFKIIYFNDNDTKLFRVFKANSEAEALNKASAWLLIGTTYQLGTIHDCLELKK